MTTRHLVTLVGVISVVVSGLTLTLWQWRGDPPPETASPAAVGGEPARDSVRAGPATRALQVLHRWDARRSAAYRAGDAAGLRRLYAPGSRAGLRDVRTLQAYRARGLRVQGMDMQVLELDLTDSTRRRLEMTVVDRLVGAYVSRGAASRPLPVDRASTRRITLVRGAVGEPWRVREVR